MRTLPGYAGSPLFARRTAPTLIALGLAILLAQIACPQLPVATAFALIALGTSITAILRCARPAHIIACLVVYAWLYLLLLGAICDAADGQLSISQFADLGLGTGVMAFVARMCIVALADDRDAQVR
jgi:hypothetical protein